MARSPDASLDRAHLFVGEQRAVLALLGEPRRGAHHGSGGTQAERQAFIMGGIVSEAGPERTRQWIDDDTSGR